MKTMLTGGINHGFSHGLSLRQASFRAAAGLLLSLLIPLGDGCVRSDPAPTNSTSPAPTSAAVKVAGVDCTAASKGARYQFDGANYWQHEIKVLKAQTDMQACARACDEAPDCKVATFSDSTIAGDWANTCVLRSSVGERHPEPSGLCSWVKPAKKTP